MKKPTTIYSNVGSKKKVSFPTEKESEDNFKAFFKKHIKRCLFDLSINATNNIGVDHYSENKNQ